MFNKVVGAFVCVVIFGLDITACILGIRAEAEQNQEKHLRLWLFECKEPSQEAYRLGVGAILLLIVAHVLATLLSLCAYSCSQNKTHKASHWRQLSYISIVFTWLIAVVGLGLLVVGTKANEKSNASCGLSHHHLLSLGGILCFVHSPFSVVYYVIAAASV